MQVQKVNFPPIMQDNEETYFCLLTDVVSAVDMDSFLMLTKRNTGIGIRIAPSEPAYFTNILEEIKKFHNMLGIQVSFSKSMKAGANITFQIDFEKV